MAKRPGLATSSILVRALLLKSARSTRLLLLLAHRTRQAVYRSEDEIARAIQRQSQADRHCALCQHQRAYGVRTRNCAALCLLTALSCLTACTKLGVTTWKRLDTCRF